MCDAFNNNENLEMPMVPKPCNMRINFERCFFFSNYTGTIVLIAIDLIYNKCDDEQWRCNGVLFHLEFIQFIQGIFIVAAVAAVA